MQDPEFYKNSNHVQRHDAVELLSEYIHLMKWTHSEDEVVLDVGCGSGDVTYEVFKPLLPRDARLVGCDVSENMLDYAAQRYSDIEFFMLDIGTKNLQEKLKNSYDHLISGYCLHWIQDQRKVMQNLYDLLKPGGDMFVYYIAYHPIFDTYPEMVKIDYWKKYMPNFQKYISPFQNEENVEEKLQILLSDVGFQVSVCKSEKKQYTYPNLKSVTNTMLSVSPYYPDLPEEFKQQYAEDITEVFINLKAIKENNQNMSGEIVMPYKINIIFVTKPKIKD